MTKKPRQFPTKTRLKLVKTDTVQTLSEIPSGAAGIAVTLDVMSRLVSEYKIHPTIRELSLQLIGNLPQKDYEGEAKALFLFVKDRIRYTRDIRQVETVQTPLKTLEYAAGDCDDKSTLLATLLNSIGFETRFRAVGFSKKFNHVIVEALIHGEWVSMDTTEPVDMGWKPQNVRINMIKNNGMGGLGAASGGAAGGAMTGATYGATVGSVIPVVGTAVGAVVGAVIGGVVGNKNSKQPDKTWKNLFTNQGDKSIDKETGMPINRLTGWLRDPNTGDVIDFKTRQPVPQSAIDKIIKQYGWNGVGGEGGKQLPAHITPATKNDGGGSGGGGGAGSGGGLSKNTILAGIAIVGIFWYFSKHKMKR